MELLRLKVAGTDLTTREVQVLRRAAYGDTVRETAERLGISYETVKSQRKMARARLGARTTAEAVAIALSLDLI
jgi:DNA-binding CsgD family transcriptional regulator